MARTVRTLAGPPVLYYLAIDGTEAQDAATFGALLEGRGWKNLATTYLKPAPDDPTRLVDPLHDFLPIPLVEARGKKIAVVSPNGRDGKGLDRFWMNFPGETQGRGGMARGRFAAAELSGDYTRRLILTPAIHTHELTPDHLSRHFADFQYPYDSRHAPAARILYVSSHGWLSGRMEGDVLEESTAQPFMETRGAYSPKARYFNLGHVMNSRLGFHGPEWIVLGQCSTLNSATWPLWAQILGRSDPGVRGILAYEEASPAAAPSAQIAAKFFQYLDQGAPFLDAWVKANPGQRWAAMVHKNARRDTLRDFAHFGPLGEVETFEDQWSYRGYLSSLGASGTPIKDQAPPFKFGIGHKSGREFQQVVPEVLGTSVCGYSPEDLYGLTITAPEDSSLRTVKVTVVHIRLSHRRQFTWDALFSVPTASRMKISGLGTTTLVGTVHHESPSVDLRFAANAKAPEGLERHHAYLWFRVDIETDRGKFQHDFKTYGLEY